MGPSAAWFYEDQLRLHRNINIIIPPEPLHHATMTVTLSNCLYVQCKGPKVTNPIHINSLSISFKLNFADKCQVQARNENCTGTDKQTHN